MPRNKDVFVYAGAKGTRKDLAGAAWPVFQDFEVEHGKDALGNKECSSTPRSVRLLQIRGAA
jgi:hypothetical protein